MAQLFSRTSNTVARVSLVGGILGIFGLLWATYAVYWSPWITRQNLPIDQEVPFSHKHHVNDDGIDCRYCHGSVEQSAFAGIPATEVCMSCHSQLWTDAPMLAPERLSLALRTRMRWNKVYDLPDFVFFNHSIHVAKGVGCSSCHGKINEMPLTWQSFPVYMKWCLDCHYDPAKQLRPKSEIYNLLWETPANQAELGARLVKEYNVRVTQLTDCSMCHR